MLSLGELAEQLAVGAPLGAGIYGTGRDGLRVLAAGPEFSSRCHGNALRELVADAREAHGLTVIDCGTLACEAEQIVAANATHLAWMLNATASGVERGRRVLAAAPRTAAKELIVARNDINQTRAPLRQLRRLAAERQAPLVLVPHLTRLESGGIETCTDEAQVPVQGNPWSAQAMTGHRIYPRSETVPAAATGAGPARITRERPRLT